MAFVGMAQRHGFDAAFDDACYSSMAYADEVYGRITAVPNLALLYAIPNGGKRDKITAAKLKAEGVKPGIPDLHWPVSNDCFKTLYIEMKDMKGRPSPEQIDVINRLRSEGHFVGICRGWEAAADVLVGYARQIYT
jgi:hypothetical protein